VYARPKILGLLLPLVMAVNGLMALSALADDTELNEGQFGPEPIGGGIVGVESVVRMESEHLDLAIGKQFASVVARFVFRNSLAVPAKQLVGFPDVGAAQVEADKHLNTRGGVAAYMGPISGPLLDVHTRVGAVEVASPVRFGYVVSDKTGFGWVASTPAKGALMAWHAMWVTFPPGKPLVIERRYHTAIGNNVLGQHLFDYVVATGGAWKGTIGELVADVTLLDGLTSKDLSWGEVPYARKTEPARKEWQTLTPTHLRLTWRDFEPRTNAHFGHIEIDTKPTRGSDGKPLR
jgi:hypothetical protein